MKNQINEIRISLKLNEKGENYNPVFAIELISETEQLLTESYNEDHNEDYNGYRIGDAIDVLWCYGTGCDGSKLNVGWIQYLDKLARSVLANCSIKKGRYKEVFEKFEGALTDKPI